MPGFCSVGADRGYDTADFIAGCRRQGVTPHVAMNDSRRRSAIDGRTTRHVGYGISQTIRMRIEQVFGWVKSVGGLRRSRFSRQTTNAIGRLHGRRRLQLAAAQQVAAGCDMTGAAQGAAAPPQGKRPLLVATPGRIAASSGTGTGTGAPAFAGWHGSRTLTLSASC